MIKSENKKALKTSLKKISGLCDRLDSMIDDDAYCMEILQQGNAGKGLFDGFNRTIVKNHLQTCGKTKLTGDNSDQFIDEFIRVIHRSS